MKQALPGSRRSMFFMDPIDITLVMDPKHVLYDPRVELEPDEPVVRNMMARGFTLTPIVLRKNGPLNEIVDGRRRFINAREANRRIVEEGGAAFPIPCLPFKGNDSEALATMIFLNELRREDSPLDKAKKAHNFMAFGRTEEETALVFGVTEQTLGHWLELLDLDPAVQGAVAKGQLSATEARKDFGDMTREDQKVKLEATDLPPATADGKKKKIRKKKTTDGKPLLRAPTKLKIREAIASLEGTKGPGAVAAREALMWAIGEMPAKDIKQAKLWESLN